MLCVCLSYLFLSVSTTHKRKKMGLHFACFVIGWVMLCRSCLCLHCESCGWSFNDNNLLLWEQPGTGKSTLMMYFTWCKKVKKVVQSSEKSLKLYILILFLKTTTRSKQILESQLNFKDFGTLFVGSKFGQVLLFQWFSEIKWPILIDVVKTIIIMVWTEGATMGRDFDQSQAILSKIKQ